MKSVWQALALLGALVAVGTIRYHTLEDMTILDALYMTVTTISTVGFGEVHPLSLTVRVNEKRFLTIEEQVWRRSPAVFQSVLRYALAQE